MERNPQRAAATQELHRLVMEDLKDPRATYRVIAARHGVTVETVYRIARLYGLERRKGTIAGVLDDVLHPPKPVIASLIDEQFPEIAKTEEPSRLQDCRGGHAQPQRASQTRSNKRMLACGCLEGEPHQGMMHLHMFTVLEGLAERTPDPEIKKKLLEAADELRPRGKDGSIYAD